MTYLTALLPAKEGVAVYSGPTRHADSRKVEGDEQGRGRIMADTLVERTTGTPGGVSRVEVQLIMTDRPHADGAGLCEACNHTRELPGGRAVPDGPNCSTPDSPERTPP